MFRKMVEDLRCHRVEVGFSFGGGGMSTSSSSHSGRKVLLTGWALFLRRLRA